jgi:hypothetical protein
MIKKFYISTRSVNINLSNPEDGSPQDSIIINKLYTEIILLNLFIVSVIISF